MSGGMPELGSKISLISKADIRYEGRLYTVDPQECTIALSNVRSFGTEDRDTQFQIAPQSQIYDYILFRGSDIKDIRVVNNSLPHPNDPAIMQVQLPNGQHLMPHFSMPSMNPPQLQPMSAAYGNPFGSMAGIGTIGGSGAPGPSSLAPGGAAPGPFMLGNQQQPKPQQQPQHAPPQQQKQPNMLAGASRSTTPISLVSRKSPLASDMGVQVTPQQSSQNQQQHHHHHHHHHNNQNNQSQNNQNHPNNSNAGHGGNSRDAGHKRQNHQQLRNSTNNPNQRNSSNEYYQQQPLQQQQNQQLRDRRDSGRNMADNFNHQNQHHDSRNNYNDQRHHQGQGQNRGWTMHRNPNNAPNMMRNRGSGGGSGGRGRMQNQGYRAMGGPGANQNKPRNNKNTIKFEQDFDFEQANNKFEELRSQLSKLKVGEEVKSEQSTTPNPPPQINGEADKKDDSGNETGAGEHEPEDEEITVGYDKTKSFFDNISCEAAQDRSKNKKNDWRQERKLNSETFGVSSTRRGSYRGRGNYYNRNASNYNGGGSMGSYNRGYRGGNNYRNRSNNGRNMGGGGGGNGGNSHANQGENNIPNTAGTGSGANGSNTTTSKIQSNGASAVAALAGGDATVASVVGKAVTQEASKSTNVSAVGSGQ